MKLELFYNEHIVSTAIDHKGSLRIFVDGLSVADISQCKRMSKRAINRLVDEVLVDLGYCY